MRTFILLLKSYSDQPDFEDELQTHSKHEALRYWYKQLASHGYDKETLKRSIIQL